MIETRSETRAEVVGSHGLLARRATAEDIRSDEELMAAVGDGDVQAYTTIVERHLHAVFRLCARLLNDRHEAEDLAQESLARLWQSAPNWRGSGGGVPAWLHRVATNLCFDRLRRRREITVDDLPEVVDQTRSAVNRMEIRQLERDVGHCLADLPDHHRAALLLSYFEGYSNAIAAQIMDMNLKAFESLLLRARRRMSDALEERGVRSADLAVLA